MVLLFSWVLMSFRRDLNVLNFKRLALAKTFSVSELGICLTISVSPIDCQGDCVSKCYIELWRALDSGFSKICSCCKSLLDVFTLQLCSSQKSANSGEKTGAVVQTSDRCGRRTKNNSIPCCDDQNVY